MFVAIDPGMTTGWALWGRHASVGLVLFACGIGDPRTCPRHVVHSEDPIDVVNDVWIEQPVIYPHAKPRPNDILKLAMNAAEWGGLYRALAVDVHYVEPAQWKGQVPKATHHARVWAALSDAERDVVDLGGRGVAPSKRHNMLDAVGLGLWVAQRAGRAPQLRVVK